ncbi:aminotransferase-like domain-containing protein [Roseobacter sinensis]|uniref:PLP-dependent aminotransferase family protein n=1 Tax=Roseobacter sinensis TaxID=2931391 RepID=A0ABT3BC12_9RHOB|nr:PLP-dependent aminotransferase family protein [Roseobacter sp. WL0113]MCV3270954.1 PLP-dependent aminotransferase family protein [Roseobacter sp. WL0113]
MSTIWQPELVTGQGPKYQAVVSSIRKGIDAGALKPGDKLPPVRDLAWRLSITPGTVARAYTILTDEGTLTAEVGRGTFVAPPRATPANDAPIEIDVIKHSAGVEEDPHNVSLFSPHLPCVGQDKLVRQVMAQVAKVPPSGVMHYPSRSGARPARDAVVHWLKGTPLGPLHERDVVLCHGGQNGILLILQAILEGRKPTVLIEELAYPGFRRAAELLRADVVPVPMDAEGIIPEALEAVARAHDAQVLCTSPEVHNPTCGFTPVARREAIARIARQRDFQIVEDDCYRMGVNRAPAYRMLAPGRGWYVSSIAKTITPALRFGYAIAPEGKSHVLRRSAEHGFFGLATPMTDVCAALLTHPDIDRVAEATTRAFHTYVQCAVNVLGAYDLVWRPGVPFLWLRLPVGWRAGAFCQAAEAQGVQIRSAEEFVCREARAPHAVRMAVNAGVSLKTFEAAMMRLRDLLDSPPEQLGV